MQRFINHENIAQYPKLIASVQGDPSRAGARYQTLRRLLAEEEAKDAEPVTGKYFVPRS